VLMWLNIVAARGQSVSEIVHAHWQEYGRHYYSRHDYEAVESAKAQAVIQTLEDQLDSLPGQVFAGDTVVQADNFAYQDSIDGSVSENQGLRVIFASGSRFVLRISGTGTVGATLRLYLEKYVPVDGELTADVQETLQGLATIADEITKLKSLTGRESPTAMS
ncbi:MAG: alpha-D-glucose phosphate-specific phosphoglucomutase, partial [Gammaproteobacteria bacterium]|nr:alpha-D-glucose phosphate-specific phosphoglucomutase [Gammaproteobacteria bacterium]